MEGRVCVNRSEGNKHMLPCPLFLGIKQNTNSVLHNIGLLYSAVSLLEQHFHLRLPRLLFDGETGLGDRLGDPGK